MGGRSKGSLRPYVSLQDPKNWAVKIDGTASIKVDPKIQWDDPVCTLSSASLLLTLYRLSQTLLEYSCTQTWKYMQRCKENDFESLFK